MQVILYVFLAVATIVSVGLIGLHYKIEKERKRDLRYSKLVGDALEEGNDEEVERLREEWRAGGCS